MSVRFRKAFSNSIQAPVNDNPSYAVKRLRHNNLDAFNAEVSNLKRFSAKDHLHLIRLLITFSWRDQYYLLFPWADGNLLDFWKAHPKAVFPKRDYLLAWWFSKQCLGIAEGLKMIHTADRPGSTSTGHVPAHQIYGRHGDLKPENILWFKAYQDAEESSFMGLLKISDFGLTRFHRTVSKSHVDAKSIGISATYRAPEYDIAKVVSQSYDIWTLGCVLLEFVTWYLLGWEEVEVFCRKRMADNESEIWEDDFFNFVNIPDGNGNLSTGARAKRSVANVSTMGSRLTVVLLTWSPGISVPL
jgi:serine/threonine protein kinase